MRLRVLLAGAACVAAFPAAAQVRAVPVAPESERAALRGVEVILLNEGAASVAAEGPRQIEVTAADGTRLVLERMPAPAVTIAPGGFARLRYVPVGLAETRVPPAQAYPAARMPAAGETTIQSATGSSSAFVDRFAPHEPVYGVFGTGDAGGKIQISFAFAPIAGDGALANLRFAYTQTMFWALDRPSGPFRATTYSPEVYADIAVDSDTRMAFGYRHDSNGRDPLGSVDVNRLFARVEQRVVLGGDWHLDIAPQAWIYVGGQGTTPDVKEYWGNASITAALIDDGGIKVALTGRGSFDTGRGAAELFVSYPLAQVDDRVGVYLFGQAFTGYGEALDDYRIRSSHARFGIALTR